jgi:hypothetical protein
MIQLLIRLRARFNEVMDRKGGSHNEKIVHKLSSYAQTPETNIGEIGIYIITNFSIDKLYCY